MKGNCLDGGGLADIVFNLRGVSWGVYHDLNITGGVQYGIYEDVATVSPLHSDQQTQMTHVQINCSSGECWRIGPGAWPVIGGVVTGVDVTENYFRDFTLNTTGSATAGLHGIGGDGNHFENFFGASANGAYDVIADCGTGTGSYSDAFRENVWTGVNIFAHGFHAVKCGSRFSYGNVIFGLKKEDSGAMVVDDGAGLTWYDTLGAINTAGSGTFGNKFPLFTAGGSASAAGVGFNQVLNSSGQWVFGLGSTFNWAALMYFDPSSGMLHYQPSSTFGAAGGVVTNADKFTVDQYGNARVYNNLTVDGFASAVWGYQLSKGAPLAAAPGAGLLRFQAVAGTNAGTCKIIAYAGTSATPTTIIDNVGGGC